MCRWSATLKFGLPLFVLFLLSPVSRAQYHAGIQGTVQDPTGAAIPGASLTLTSKETGHVETTTTDASGVYNFLSLAPGDYSIAVTATGFSGKTLQDVVVAAEQTQAVNIQLELGQVQQSVTVTAEVAPVLNTQNGQMGTTLTNNQVQNLPAFGRDTYRLLALAPGAFGDNGVSSGGGSQNTPGSAGPGGSSASSSIFQTENQVQINADGQRNTGNSFLVDGVGVNSLDWGGAAIITPSEESVKQIQIVTNSYDATLGRNSAAQIRVVSQNGTNNFHGSVVYKMDRPWLNAYQRVNNPNVPNTPTALSVLKVTSKLNQIGGSVGGPIVKNHLFFFFAYETLRNNAVNTATTWAETPQFLHTVGAETGYIAGNLLSFPGEGASYTTVLPITCAAANIPATNCHNVAGGLDIGSPLTGTARGTADPTYGQTATPYGIGGGFDGVPDIQFVQTANPTDSTQTQYNGRADFQVTPLDLVAYSIYWVPDDSTFYNGQARAANLWHTDRLNYSHALLWNHVISPTLINEVRFNISRWYYNELQSNPQEPWGLPNDTINLCGACSVSAIVFGTNGPGIFYKTDYNFRDIATKVVGNNTFRFGLDLHKEQNTDTQAGGARPTYAFQNMWNFANDAPLSEGGNFNPMTGVPTSATHYIRSNDDALFVQDDWKATHNLTLNLGLRWEYFGPIHEKYNNISTPVLGTGADPLLGIHMQVGGNVYQVGKHNFGPQIGFAWTPSALPMMHGGTQNGFVVRGGFGIGYNRMEEAITLNGRANPPLIGSFGLFGSNIVYAVPSNTHQFSPWPANPNTVLTFNSAGLPASGAPVTLTGFPSYLPSPYSYRYSLEVQDDLGHSWIATLGYQGSASHHLTRLENNLNLNYSPLNPAVQQLSLFTNDADGAYNALLTEIQHHFSRTFELDAQYTYSRSMDDASNDYYWDQYPFNAKAGWGPSDYDATHNLKLWGSWSPVIFSSGNWMEKLIGGWVLSPIWNVHSGFPWTPVYNVQLPETGTGNTCNIVYVNSGYCTVRPAAYLGGAGRSFSNKTFEQPLGNFAPSPALFFLPPTLSDTGIPPVPGVRRNSFRGPRFNNVDFTIAKSFGFPAMRVIGEGARLELRGDFYNLFNQTNFVPLAAQNIGTLHVPTTGPETVTPSSTFGQAQSAEAGRVVELQARFSF
jgi:hypothetical protein